MTEPTPKAPAPKPKGDVWGAVKWVCILLVILIVAASAWKAWSVATAPARAVISTVDAAKAGAQNTTEAVGNVVGRLGIAVTKQRILNKRAESAFEILTALPVSEPSLKDRATRASYLGGADNRVCETEVDFGAGPVPVWVAADNGAYATSKALGGTSDRMIRIAIFAEGDTVGLRTLWDNDAKAWSLRWKRTTLKKPVVDDVAEARVLDVLAAVAKDCRS